MSTPNRTVERAEFVAEALKDFRKIIEDKAGKNPNIRESQIENSSEWVACEEWYGMEMSVGGALLEIE
jgi:hypothetical protein